MTTASVHEHRKAAPTSVVAAVLTISDSRSMDDDTSGNLICSLLGEHGHKVMERRVVPDERQAITHAILELVTNDHISVVLTTGGTGVSKRDVTIEALRPLMQKELPGFGELFRYLGFKEIGSATILSRATAGIIDATVVFVMPGSVAAVELAMTRIVLPEIGHLVFEITKQGAVHTSGRR